MKLGTRVRDSITGLEGVAIARTEWLYGCVRIGVQPTELRDGKPAEQVWFDEAQLEPIAFQEPPPQSPSGTTGGPRREPKAARPADFG